MFSIFHLGRMKYNYNSKACMSLKLQNYSFILFVRTSVQKIIIIIFNLLLTEMGYNYNPLGREMAHYQLYQKELSSSQTVYQAYFNDLWMLWIQTKTQ